MSRFDNLPAVCNILPMYTTHPDFALWDFTRAPEPLQDACSDTIGQRRFSWLAVFPLDEDGKLSPLGSYLLSTIDRVIIGPHERYADFTHDGCHIRVWWLVVESVPKRRTRQVA